MEKQNNNVKIILYVLAAIIVLISIILFSKLNAIEEKLEQGYYNTYIYNNVDYSQIGDIVSEKLGNQTYLNIQTEWASEYKDNKILLDCSVVLNEAKESDIVHILYKSTENNNWKSEELKKGLGLSYSGSITLDAFTEYEYYIMSEGKIQQASKINYIPKEYYYINLEGDMWIESENSEDIFVHIFFDPWVNQSLVKGQSFTSFRAEVYSNDILIDRIEGETAKDYFEVEISSQNYDKLINKIVFVAVLENGEELTEEVYNADEIEFG